MKKDEQLTLKNEAPDHGYVFTLEVMVEGKSNSHALEKLLHALNTGDIKDHRILNGIEFGKLIAQVKTDGNYKKSETAIPPQKKEQTANNTQPGKNTISPDKDILSEFRSFQAKGTLVRLQIVKGKGVRLSIPCRILNFDSENNNVSVYHVDEKKAYLFKLNEIDDYIVF
ncbi:MAG TPA: hypothetical protein VF260_05205 [Bacilli bacterium]